MLSLPINSMRKKKKLLNSKIKMPFFYVWIIYLFFHCSFKGDVNRVDDRMCCLTYCQSRFTRSQSSMNGLSIRLIMCSPQYKHSAAKIVSISFLMLSRCVKLVPPLMAAASVWPAIGTLRLKFNSCCFNFDNRKMCSLPKWKKFDLNLIRRAFQ